MSRSHRPEGSVWTFADFEPGTALGTIDLALDADRRAHWDEVYGESVGAAGAIAPQGLAVALMMDAYVKVIQPRPPGNVHAMQTLSFTGAEAAWGDLMHFDFTVADKERKRDRRWVTFSVTGRTGADVILTGEIRAIWSA